MWTSDVPALPLDQLELLADMIAERLAKRLEAKASKPASGLVDANELAGELGVSTRFVYEHAAELGAQRLGNGSKPRLRFDVDTAKSVMRCSP